MTDAPLRVGDVLYGFCGGEFGRDFFATEGARVEAIGSDWVIVRNPGGSPEFARCAPESLARHREPILDD